MEISAKIDFIKANLKSPVVLVGLMGAGKTSIGEALGKALDCSFVDSDAVIVEQHGHISEIFAQKKGESVFRKIERETIQEILAKKTADIIGTGGGAFTIKETRELIEKEAISIFLEADLEVLVERVGSGAGRPLVEDKDTRATLSNFISERYPIYALADISVETRHEGEQETLHRVIDALYMHLQP